MGLWRSAGVCRHLLSITKVCRVLLKFDGVCLDLLRSAVVSLSQLTFAGNV